MSVTISPRINTVTRKVYKRDLNKQQSTTVYYKLLYFISSEGETGNCIEVWFFQRYDQPVMNNKIM